MPRITIGAGVMLTLLALLTYFGTGMSSITALIPAFFGVPLILLGWLAHNGQRRKTMMHIAIALGALGFIAPMSRIVPSLGSLELNVATGANIVMAIICGIYVALGVRSFIEARRNPPATT
ncbi:MAG: hypothetical protein ACUVSY_01980 [Roseiflexus sp.]